MIIHDGSRLFLDMPESITWNEMFVIIKALEGAEIIRYISDEVTEFWLDFSFREQRFSVNNPMGEYWFFAEDAECPTEIMQAVIQAVQTGFAANQA